MSDVVIRAEGLGKKYLIGHQAERERYTALRDVAARTARGLVRSVRDMARGRQMIQGDEVEEFWALKDINFEIKRGDVVGIIGRNGAGKSTLLKILSRITEPSTGRVEIKGRVASLLEVGTGFHPELTGRENIYLNGAILGMTRGEIRRKFDEIVDFAEVEKFLDTPVKRYSSGMYVRLAFAVAAHLEPEILVVDEVLAVGDAEFQKKCLGKMGEVAGHGRTVLFVSHQLASIARFCTRAILIGHGQVAATGMPAEVIQFYLSSAPARSVSTAINSSGKPVTLGECWSEAADGVRRGAFNSNEPILIQMEIEVHRATEAFRVGFRLHSADFGVIFFSEDADERGIVARDSGHYRLCCTIPANLLSPGDYALSFAADIPMRAILFDEPESLHFSVSPIGAVGEEFEDGRRGAVRPLLPWRCEKVSAALDSELAPQA